MPERHLQGLATSHDRLLATLAGLTDEQARRPSRLPGWTRDLLVAHLRFAGEALLRAADAAAEGMSAAMYPGGDAQRDAEIASGKGRAAADLVAEHAAVARRIQARLASLPAEAWDVTAVTRRGPAPIRELVLQRWVDVEAHHVDLDLGYTTDDWPDSLVDAYLPGWMQVVPALRGRPDADRSVVGSWRLRRRDGPGEWVLHADTDHGWLTEGVDEADCVIEAPGRALLAVTLGRRETDGLDVSGDRGLAVRLKAAFPGP